MSEVLTSPHMKIPHLLLSVLVAGAVAELASAQEVRVETSAELLGKPKYEDKDEPERFRLATPAAERARAEVLEIIDQADKHLVRFELENTTAESQEFTVSTAFIKSDGSIVATPTRRPRRIVDGAARVFAGIVSMGLTEVATDHRVTNATLKTTHGLAAGEALIVEHELPFEAPHVVGSYTFVSWTDPNPPKSDGVNDLLDEETQRYRALETELRAEMDKHEFNTPEWKAANDKFWAAHREHFERRRKIREGELRPEPKPEPEPQPAPEQ